MFVVPPIDAPCRLNPQITQITPAHPDVAPHPDSLDPPCTDDLSAIDYRLSALHPAPLDSTVLDLLLARHPAVAARVLIAMPHRRRWAQLCAYAALLDVPTTRLQHEWADLFTHAAPPDDAPRVCAPLDPVDCALRDPADLAAALHAMTPAQRMAQAVAQAAWLSSFGYPVTAHEILAGWETPTAGRRAG